MRGKFHVVWTGMLLGMLCVACQSCGVELFANKRAEAQKAYDDGVTLLSAGKYDEAIEKFIVSSYLAPDVPASFVSLCQAYAAKGDLANGQTACEKAVLADDDNPASHYMLGSIYLLAGNLEKAKTQFNVALQKNKEFAPALTALGAVELQLGNDKRAVEVLLEARKSGRENSALLSNLAIGLLHTQRCDEANLAIEDAQKAGANVAPLYHLQKTRCPGVTTVPIQTASSDPAAAASSVAAVEIPVTPTVSHEGMIQVSDADGRVFFIDERSANGIEFSKCVDEKVCKRPPYDEFNRAGEGRLEPAMSVNYFGAEAYCKWKHKRLPTLAEYQAAFTRVEWRGCCVRGVIPGEWTSDTGENEEMGLQVRRQDDTLSLKTRKKKTGVDSSTVRCAADGV